MLAKKVSFLIASINTFYYQLTTLFYFLDQKVENTTPGINVKELKKLEIQGIDLFPNFNEWEKEKTKIIKAKLLLFHSKII